MKQHETEIRVRYEDADPMGLLHHSKYLSYFEIGRTDMFRAAGGDYRAMEASGLFVVVVKVVCRYRKPAYYDDVLTVRTTLKQVSAAKIVHEYELLRESESLASAEVTLAVVDRKGEAQPVPEWLAEKA